MTVIAMSKITSKGQMTLPSVVRKLLKLDKGQSVAFCVDRKGVFLYRCSINVDRGGFSDQEWHKIEKLAAQKGKVYASAEEAKKHVRML
jgi:bifunctional DNA-binding transcriptional regulator/antitoxin component of YhaV-PrlF toxin-antitoxin module